MNNPTEEISQANEAQRQEAWGDNDQQLNARMTGKAMNFTDTPVDEYVKNAERPFQSITIGELRSREYTTQEILDMKLPSDIRNNTVQMYDYYNPQISGGHQSLGTNNEKMPPKRLISDDEFTTIFNSKYDDGVLAFKDALLTHEGHYGNSSYLHKPPSADDKGSGWTIGNGLDAKFTNKKEMEALGVPTRITDYIDAHGAYDVSDVPLPEGQEGSELQMTEEEYAQVTYNIANKSRNDIKEIINSNPNLSPKAAGYLAQIKHWAGSLSGTTESKTTRYSGSLSGDAPETGELIAPIQKLLDSGNATDEGLIEAILLIRDSYEEGANANSWRYQTMTNYAEELGKD